jgi:hypothetical protein
VREREDLCAVLIVAARIPSLDADALAMGEVEAEIRRRLRQNGR